jgi:hypothetical protein
MSKKSNRNLSDKLRLDLLTPFHPLQLASGVKRVPRIAFRLVDVIRQRLG